MKLHYGKVAKEYERYDLQNIGDVSVRRLLLLLLSVLSSICCLFLLVKAQNLPSSVAFFSVQGEPTQLSLPFCIEDSSLVAMRIYSYDGPFWEDEPLPEVGKVSALWQTVSREGILIVWKWQLSDCQPSFLQHSKFLCACGLAGNMGPVKR